MDDNQNPTGAVPRIVRWVQHPFSGDMDAMHWFLLVGLILIAAFLWSRIYAMIVKEV